MSVNRTTIIMLKLSAPAIGLAFLAMLSEWAIAQLAANPVLRGVGDMLTVAPPLLLALSAMMVLVGIWRFWKWERGDEIGCIRCGGPLGRVRAGRWGPYRKCLGCGANESAKTYV